MIDFSTNTQNVNFGNLPTVRQLSNKTIMGWILIDDLDTGTWFSLTNNNRTDETFVVGQLNAGSTVMVINALWSVTDGLWYANAALTASANLKHFAVSYNYGSTANDPVFYINGVNYSTVEVLTPAGSYVTGTSGNGYLGSGLTAPSTLEPTANCKLLNLNIYNRILTAAEILDAYNSRLAIPNYNGLVFAPDLRGAAGGVDDGDTLATANVIRDRISGASGVPAGSPVLRADNYLNYK